MRRFQYIWPLSFAAILIVVVGGVKATAEAAFSPEDDPSGAKAYLKSILYTPREVDDWFARRSFSFGKYDSEMGFLLDNRTERHGWDNSICTYTYDPETGARRLISYPEKACRINTYGDSFVQCEQVNDGETWQEVLAGHLGEPVRNYGTGNSIYWAYLRMLREEKRTPATYIIFNIYEGDHHRNMISWQRIAYGQRGPKSFHPTIPYVRVNPATGEFSEHPNTCPTRESVANLCDFDWVYDKFKDDFYLKIAVARQNQRDGTPERSYEVITKLAAEHGIDAQVDSPQKLHEITERIISRAGMFATLEAMERVAEYCRQHGKKLLFILSYGSHRVMLKYIEEGVRFDQPIVDLLDEKGWPYVDLLEAHAKDFVQFKISFEDYHARYYVGHYGPAGNFFYAFALKDKLVEMLDPKPIPYQGRF